MDSRTQAFSTSNVVADPAEHLVCSADDFSIKVLSKLDPRFWVRVERAPNEGMLVVTDFTAGDRPVAELEAGLLLAVGALHRGIVVRAVIFRDLVPSGDQSEGFPVRVLQAAELVKQLGAMVANGLDMSTRGFELKPRRGKIDAVITCHGPHLV